MKKFWIWLVLPVLLSANTCSEDDKDDLAGAVGVEKEFDQVAEGNKKWNDMIQNFYGDFHLKVEDVIGNAEKALGERNLGKDPVSGNNVYVRIGPFGPMVQIGEKQEDENAPKPKFASLLKDVIKSF